jgi:IS1 family transposase
MCSTDLYAVYTGVIPAAQHKAITKQARTTKHIERFNTTRRQRVSRLVRDTLASPKSWRTISVLSHTSYAIII